MQDTSGVSELNKSRSESAGQVESLSTPAVQSGIASAGNASTATPLEKHDTTPGPVEVIPVPKAKQRSLEAERGVVE